MKSQQEKELNLKLKQQTFIAKMEAAKFFEEKLGRDNPHFIDFRISLIKEIEDIQQAQNDFRTR